MADADYERGYSDGYDCGLSKDKDTSFLLLAARIDELKIRNAKLEALVKELADELAGYAHCGEDDSLVQAARAALAVAEEAIKKDCAEIASSGLLPCDIGGDLILDRNTADTISSAILASIPEKKP